MVSYILGLHGLALTSMLLMVTIHVLFHN